MKKFAMVCTFAALTACSEASRAPDTQAQAGSSAAEVATPSWPAEAGTYEYTRSDGTAGVNTLAADGTFSNAIAGGGAETGTWGQENGMTCLSPEGGEKRCYTFTEPDANGNFVGTMLNGVTVKLQKTA